MENNFSANLRNLMNQKDLTAKEVGTMAGLSFRTIQGWLDPSRKSTPRADDAVVVARALGTTVEYLVTGELFPRSKQYAAICDAIALLDDERLLLAEKVINEFAAAKKQASPGEPLRQASGE